MKDNEHVRIPMLVTGSIDYLGNVTGWGIVFDRYIDERGKLMYKVYFPVAEFTFVGKTRFISLEKNAIERVTWTTFWNGIKPLQRVIVNRFKIPYEVTNNKIYKVNEAVMPRSQAYKHPDTIIKEIMVDPEYPHDPVYYMLTCRDPNKNSFAQKYLDTVPRYSGELIAKSPWIEFIAHVRWIVRNFGKFSFTKTKSHIAANFDKKNRKKILLFVLKIGILWSLLALMIVEMLKNTMRSIEIIPLLAETLLATLIILGVLYISKKIER